MVCISKIAHYGRWYPYYGGYEQYWWYDKYIDKVISIDDICSENGLSSPEDVDVEICIQEDKIPLFRVNIPELELRYAKEYMRKEAMEMMKMGMREMDYAFGRYIDNCDLITHWYIYELNVLSKAAREWCKEYKIPYVE